MKIGLVGKPSAGKSTFFKAATLAEVDIANYPFTTIKANEAMGYVKIDCADKDFDKQCNPRMGFCLKHKRFVPVEMIDVAGLVPGAHENKGRGNQFLDDLRQADALIHVVDASGSVNAEGEPVETGSYDPCKDIIFLEEELDMWYLGILNKGWEKFARTIQQEKQEAYKALAKQLSGLGVDEDMVQGALARLKLPEQVTSWGKEELKRLAVELRKKTKPMIIAANKVDVPVAKENVERMKKDFPDYIIISCSAESELALREAAKHELIDYVPGEDTFTITKKGKEKLTEQQQKALSFLQKNILDVWKNTGVQQVLDTAVLDVLKYIAIFPGGVNNLVDSQGRCLPDCFLLKDGSTALDFAFKLHTDFGKKFIRAIDVKTKRTVGKEHVLQHRDVVEIVSGK
jgi:ribosome-binding ATPase